MKKLYFLFVISLVFGISYGQNDLPELIYYKFDDGSTIVNDADNPVGANPASITGTGLSVGGSGLFATALQGTGVNSTGGVINTGWNTDLSGSFTIGFWTSNIPTSTTLYYIFGDAGAGSFRCFTNGFAGSNNWMVRGGGLPDLVVTGAATANPNYIHIVYDASAGTYTSYVDGVLNTTVTAPTSNTMSGSGFQVGGYGTNSNLSGLMDEFRVYNRALGLAEIQATISGPILGENEDCFSPADLTLANLTASTAEFTWTASPDVTNGYDWVLMNLNDDPDIDTPLQSGNTAATNVTISGLVENKYYVFYVQTDCGVDGVSVWRNVLFYIAGEGANCAEAKEVLSLPYTDTANTIDFLNLYSGSPGNDCGTTDQYLNGYDVVYKYTADDDYILTIELSGLSDAYSGVFIYESCADIGDFCAAEGSFNETSGTHSFQVSVDDTKDYYIVVSSADPTVSTGYTLTITGTTCANYSPPSGNTAQNFIDDQTLADLDVSGSNIIWYSDAAATTMIPDDTVLVNNTTYYVTQTFQGCESAPLAITVTEVACTALNVVTSSGSAVCGEGSVTLTAQGAEPAVNTHIYWYDAATGGNRVGIGNQFETPDLEQTTSYWASEVALTGGELPGQAKPAPIDTASTTLSNYGLEFIATEGFTLYSVDVYPNGPGGPVTVELWDSSNNTIDDITVTVPAGTATTPETITLGFDIPQAGTYRLMKQGATNLVREFAAGGQNVFPYPIGTIGDVTGGVFGTGSPNTTYYFFYNWTIGGADVICESSPREEVVATVNEVADEMVTEPLPFVHTANTSAYDNNYSGAPGNDCGGTGDFLDGNDVVYQFSPTVGAVYSVQLSNLTSDNAAVFVYESCYDIGSGCYAGEVSGGTTGDFGIDEVVMYDGHDYFIVISTSDFPSTGYTLTIDTATINCADYTDAPIGDEEQFMEDGDTLADLDVKGGNLTWYSDAAGTNPIPDTTVMVDGDTYYVGQTLNGCPSDLLAITVTEIVCDNLEILSTTGATIVCKGTADLVAVGNGGLGTEIYWYSSDSGGDPIGTGSTFTTPELTATTSYWAAEVFLESGSGPSGNIGPVDPSIGTSSVSSLTNHGANFNVLVPTVLSTVDIFPTAPVGTNGTIEIREGTSATSGTIVETIPYTTTVSGSLAAPVAQTVTINVSLPVGTYTLTPGVGINLIRNTNGAQYPYTSSAIEITGNTFNVDYWYWFYNWQFGDGTSVLCESDREEVIATVTQDGDIVVPPALPYIDSNNNTANYGNTFSGEAGTGCGSTENYLNGNDVVYMFTPTTDDYIDIVLSDLTDFYAGLFVYESCGNIGDDCVAGVVAGPSSNGISIDEFHVTAGQTYYIVVSSWLTSSIDYTLEINGFVCANFPAPEGDSPQDFVVGDTLDDLEVEGTTPSSTITWYSDAAGQNPLPPNTPLVNGTTYYVGQTFNNCDSPLLAITVSEIDCSDLEILSVTGDSVVCLGAMTLQAIASGSGSEIYWYDVPSGGDPIATGSTFTTDILTSTTSYWATEVHLQGDAPLSGQAKVTNTANAGYAPTGTNDFGLVFTATSGFTIADVEVLSSGAGGPLTVELRQNDNQGAVLESVTVNVVGGGSTASPVPSTLTLNFQVPGPGTYYICGFNGPSMIRDTGAANNNFPYPLGTVGEITSGHTWNNSYPETYYFFYNWTIGSGQVLCESPREEVIATVTGDGDVVIPGVPYTTTDNTTLYGNNFTGSPGSDCGTTGNYLDGNDVVYQYTPTADDIVNIELTGVSNQNAGLFVYESCGDIGTSCIAGTISEGGLYEINDFYMTAGQSYYIVISTQTGSTGYTLNIDGFVCTDLDAPIGDATQYYVGTNTLDDLTIEGHEHSTGFNWYTDAAGQNPVPANTPLVDGETYYVSQTVLGCESPLMAVTVEEFQCSDLEIVSTTSDVVCQSGSMTLTAQGSGIGNEIYWYSSQSGGNPISVGSVFETPNLTTTTSYWAEEVFIEGTAPLTGQAKPAPIDTANTTLTNYGLAFEAFQNFTLMSVDVYPNTAGGPVTVELREDDGVTVIQSVTVTVPSGNLTTPHTIPLNFTIPPGTYRLMKVGATNLVREFAAAGQNVFPYPIGTVGQVNGGVFGTGSPNTTYYFFYNWTIGDGIVLCESPRVEAIAEVNTAIPNAPVSDAVQEFCDEGFTVSDLDVTGSNITWYNASGSVLSANTALQDGVKYYASQTINACESNKTEVTVTITPKSPIPQGNINQTYQPGETLADLNVSGQNLIWYSDPQGNNQIPSSTQLEDVATYYVSQTVTDLCESDLLGITVHRGALGVVDVVFADLQYYPNPVDGVLNITNSHTIDTVEVYSLLGQKVSHQQVGFSTTTVDMSGLASGAYLVKITIDDKVGFYRVIKK